MNNSVKLEEIASIIDTSFYTLKYEWILEINYIV